MPRRGRYSGTVDDKAIGKRLKDVRVSKGKSQTELAQELGINQSLISEYEQGSVRIHAPLLAGFAKALRTSADVILGLKGKAARNGGPKNRRFAKRLRQIEILPADQQKAVLKLLDGVLQSQKSGGRRSLLR